MGMGADKEVFNMATSDNQWGHNSRRCGEAALARMGWTMRHLAMIDELLAPFFWVAKLSIFLGAVVMAVYAFDREPPFTLLSVEPAIALPGHFVKITAKVHRDTSRNCTASFSRYIHDGAQTRFFSDASFASDAMIDTMEKKYPGKLMIAIRIPDEAVPGPAQIETILRYQCNKVHALWPIEVTLQMPFTILDPL